MIELGNKIRKLRRERGLTQEQFASALSITPQAVSKWESNGGYPDMSMIPILANFFDVTLDELFDFDITKKAQRLEDILAEAGKYFWDHFEKALTSFWEAADVVERFMIGEKSGYAAYPIGGTDANHMCYYLGIAGCYFKLTDTNECSKAIEKAKNIFIPSAQDRWPCCRKKFLETFEKAYVRYGLADYTPFREWYAQNGIEKYVAEA